MEDKLIEPFRDKVHPATIIMLNYLNKSVSMKKLFDWKTFFKRRSANNKLAKSLFDAAEKIIEGQTVEEIDFMALMWMILRFDKDEELAQERQELEREKRELNKK